MKAPPRSIRDENLTLADLMARYSDYSRSVCKTLFLMVHFRMNPELIESALTFIVNCEEAEWPRDGGILVFLPGLGENFH